MAAVAFDVFGFIRDSRRAYGVRAQDYQHYRRSCARRLQAVRKAAGLSQGTQAAFRRRDVTPENASQPAHVEILLLQAERAWAYAMDLRELYACTEEPRQRHHLVSRLRAACKAARQLAAAGPSFCDAHTALAAHAYWLQLQSQLHFELQEWTAALDCAAVARVVGDRLALAGGRKQSAFADTMSEALDPVIRLAAHQARVPGAQHTPPAAIAAQWYETHAKDAPGRSAESSPGLGDTIAALERLSEESDRGIGGATHAHSLSWRGGTIGFADQELALLMDEAQRQLKAANEGAEEALDGAAAAFRRVQRRARQCQPERGCAPEPAYYAALLCSVCALNAIAVAKLTIEAKAIAAAHNIGPGTGPWITDDVSGQPAGERAKLPTLTRLVVCYDRVRKSVAALQAAVANALAVLPPSVSRAIGAQRLAEEAAAAAAYYRCTRNYYSAVLHASPSHGQHQDALALLDTVVTDDAPRAAALVAALAEAEGGAPRTGDSQVDILWSRRFVVSATDVAAVAAAAEAALPTAQGLCAAAQRAEAAPRIWLRDPSRPPATAANKLAAGRRGASERPPRVPLLADVAEPAFAAVPIKPLFYDLAAAAIDFDTAALDAQAGSKQSGGGLGALIGSLWAR
ncbi:signal recognition particle subunit srp68 [Coemansia biformis]|uniref:Signal recognition particle subunit SRP68 n=1 Tax=Coemansia biformis TaxID=1286918 RepID=A0A9W8D0H4_9FUNG|nr:signal recognition particle subunit srp68 [Coemansia biformis]